MRLESYKTCETVVWGVCVLAAASPAGCTQILGLTEDYHETFCAKRSPQPLFCQDFDEGSYQVGGTTVQTTGGTVSLDTDKWWSAPASLKTQSYANSSPSGVVNVAVYQPFALAGNAFVGTLDLDLRVDQADSCCSSAVLAQLRLADPNNIYFVQLVETSDGSGSLSGTLNELTMGSGPVAHFLSKRLNLKTWTHVTLTVRAPFKGGPGTVALSFDGTPALLDPMGNPAVNGTLDISVPVKDFDQTVGVGLTYVSLPSVTGWTVFYDDVVFDATVN